ncbi:MAG: polysaccharide deacetylase family protein [Frankiales bacterium]|nr:polysaccharide deacetylase family protein [Frankiales bacterium]
MAGEHAGAGSAYPRAVRSAPGAATAVPVLLYHDVTDEPGDPYAVDHATFLRHMRAVAASGRDPLTVDHYADALAGRAPMPSRPVLVTFDDGYPEFPRAVDSLARAGVAAATVYVTTGEAGTPGRVRWADLAALPEWVQVGAHSRTHPQLDVLPRSRLLDEVAGSRDDVEQRLARPCTSFAYPHGHHDRSVRSAVVEAGFASACGVKNALSHPHDDVFAIARVTITRTTGDDELAQYLEGTGAPIAWKRERLRTKGFRYYRRARSRVGAHA